MEVVKYDLAESQIEEFKAAYMGLTVAGEDDKEGAAAIHEARMIVKSARVAVEARRKELKADALAWGRKVDAEAKRLTGLLEPIESHLQGQEEIVTRAAERREAEARAKERAELEARRLAAEEEARQARQEAYRLAEQADLERLARENAERKLEEARRQHQAANPIDVPWVPPEVAEAYGDGSRLLWSKAPEPPPEFAVPEPTPTGDRELLVAYADRLMAVPVPRMASTIGAMVLKEVNTRLEAILEYIHCSI